jgi:hypothetical protein
MVLAEIKRAEFLLFYLYFLREKNILVNDFPAAKISA